MALVDQFGRPVGSRRPELREVGGISTVRDIWSGYPTRGLNAGKLATILREADQGHISRQAELFEEMEEKDGHLGSVLGTRKRAVAGLDWEVQPASDHAEDMRAAEAAREMLDDLDGLDDLLLDVLDGVGKGFSMVEIMWDVSGGQAWAREFRHRHQKRFTFTGPDGAWSELPRLLTDASPVYGEELPVFKFIFHRANARSGITPRDGLLRPCAWMYLFKNLGVKDWMIFAERFAMPIRVGKYHPGADSGEIGVLTDAVMNLASDAAAVLPESTAIELLEQQARAASSDLYEGLVRFCDATMSKAVLGHAASSDSTPGRLGAEGGAREVRQDLLESDARGVERTLRRQLLWPFVLYNFGPETRVPRFVLRHEPPEDLKETAGIYATLVERAGLRIPARHMYEKFGIPQPEGDEDVLGLPPGADE
jgi:phage gp29-like protein